MILERDFQRRFIQRLKNEFDGCIVLKNDEGYIQGIPDTIVLYGPHWAALELKRRRGAKRQPNQDFYIDYMDKMSFAAFVEPENEEEVFRALQLAFGTRR